MGGSFMQRACQSWLHPEMAPACPKPVAGSCQVKSLWCNALHADCRVQIQGSARGLRFGQSSAGVRRWIHRAVNPLSSPYAGNLAMLIGPLFDPQYFLVIEPLPCFAVHLRRWAESPAHGPAGPCIRPTFLALQAAS